jgi:hypothetical protein
MFESREISKIHERFFHALTPATTRICIDQFITRRAVHCQARLFLAFTTTSTIVDVDQLKP